MLQRVIFAGGGTGGHVFMAVALRDELMKDNPDLQALFVGTKRGLENRILPPLGFPLEHLRIGGWKNVDGQRKMRTALQLPGSLLTSRKLIRRFAPQLVVGLGGFASGPVVTAAWLDSVPTMVVEPNVIPGFANRISARFCTAAAVAFEETARFFGGKARVTGIPIREEFHQIQDLDVQEGPLRVLIFGGSRGSRPINRLVCNALPLLSSLPLSIVHQTGSDDFEEVSQAYATSEVKAEVTDFIDDMPRQFASAQLVISRSGASTIAEITAAGRPAVLIPFPHAADDHQRRNAEALASRGAAVMLEQRHTRPGDLARVIGELADDRPGLQRMAQATRELARRDSTSQIAAWMRTLAGGQP